LDVISTFLIASIIIFIGYIGELVFQKTHIPDVIWLLLLGVILGPITGIVNPSLLRPIAPLIGSLALIIILFEGGLNMDIYALLKSVPRGTILSLSYFILSALSVASIMFVLGWPVLNGLLLGTIVGGLSSAIIIPMTRNLELKQKTTLMLTVESAVSDILCIVLSIALIEIIAEDAFVSKTVLNNIAGNFSIGAVVGFVSGIVWINSISKVEKESKAYMPVIAFLLLLYSVVEYIGGNGAIATLLFGVVLGNAKKIGESLRLGEISIITPTTKFFYAEISFFVKSFFFVYLGILLTLTDYTLITTGFALTIAIGVIRPIAVYIATWREKFDSIDVTTMKVLIPRGLAAAVLAQIPLSYGIDGAESFVAIVFSVIFFSILFTTLGHYYIFHRTKRETPKPKSSE
jgi:cell volume regulation protein A